MTTDDVLSPGIFERMLEKLPARYERNEGLMRFHEEVNKVFRRLGEGERALAEQALRKWLIMEGSYFFG
jgi:hypothetical protein